MSRKRVIVGMSGGVDSSVAAALLVEQGYEVIGVTLNVWPNDNTKTDGRSCCALSAVEDARRVSDALGIAHYTLNFKDLFARTVVADFVAEYSRGRTPNPCIRCNEHIKFAAVLARARGLDPDYIATGHYCRLTYHPESGRHLLRKASDRHKDQSYVLYVLTQDTLARTLFPLGDYQKETVRALAAQLGLATANKAESQDICFIPDNKYGRFLSGHCVGPIRPGPILDGRGKLIGEHKGIVHYTVGQRKGLNLGEAGQLFVVAIDAARNAIVVGGARELESNFLIAERVNLVSSAKLNDPLRVTAQVRYRGPEEAASISPMSEDRVAVYFDKPQRAITPGQAVVFYHGDLLIGGGTIARPQLMETAAAS